MATCWRKDLIIGYSKLILHPQDSVSNMKPLPTGCAMNQATGIITIMNKNGLNILRPLNSSQYELLCVVPNIPFNPNFDRLRFVNNDIFIFNGESQTISHYKLSIAESAEQTELSFTKLITGECVNNFQEHDSGSYTVQDILITDHLLLCFINKRINIYKLYPQLSFYHGITFIKDTEFRLSPTYNTHLCYKDNDITLYINYNKRLLKFDISRPEWTSSQIIHSQYFGDNDCFCGSKKYGIFWISPDGKRLFQSIEETSKTNIQLIKLGIDDIDSSSENFIKTPNSHWIELQNIAEFVNCKYDESFGISGRLLLFCRTMANEYVILQCYNNNEVSMVYDLCHVETDLDPIYQRYKVYPLVYEMLYGDLEPIANIKMPSTTSKNSIAGMLNLFCGI